MLQVNIEIQNLSEIARLIAPMQDPSRGNFKPTNSFWKNIEHVKQFNLFQTNSVEFGQGSISAASFVFEKFFRTPTYPSRECLVLGILKISETTGITRASQELSIQSIVVVADFHLRTVRLVIHQCV